MGGTQLKYMLMGILLFNSLWQLRQAVHKKMKKVQKNIFL